MSIIKGKGIPSRETKGAIGDTYINVLTGIKYKCVDSYKISGMNSETVYCNWKRIGVEQKAAETKPTEEVKAPENVTEEKTVENEPVEEEAIKNAGPEPVAEPKRKRSNYADAYKLKEEE